METIYNGYSLVQPRLQYRIPSCTNCLSWLQDVDSDPAVCYPPPENFPQSELGADGQIRPFKLTFEKLIAAGMMATEKIKSGNWTVQNADSYLDVHCIVDNTRNDIIQRASLQRQRHLMEVSGEDDLL